MSFLIEQYFKLYDRNDQILKKTVEDKSLLVWLGWDVVVFEGIIEPLNDNGENYYKMMIYPHIFFLFCD